MARDEESGSSSEEEERVEAESSEGETSSGEEEEAASESGSGSEVEESGDEEEEEEEGEDEGEAMELDENGERHYKPPANFKRFESDKLWIDAKELNPQHHELWLVRMPKTLSAEALKGLKLELPVSSLAPQRPSSSGASGVTGLKEVVRLQQGKKNYSVVASGEEYRSLHVIVPTRSSSTSSLKFLDANLPLSRQLNIIEAIDVPEITLEETLSTSSSSSSSKKIPPPPENMKVTYLPIGAVGLDFDWRAAKRKSSSSTTSSEAKSPKKKKLTNETPSTPSSSKSKTVTKAPSTPLTPAAKDKKGSSASTSTPSSTKQTSTPKKDKKEKPKKKKKTKKEEAGE